MLRGERERLKGFIGAGFENDVRRKTEKFHFRGGDEVKEIIFFGRGGQGAVIASQVLAKAAFSEGKYAHAFPMFGSERKGSPVQAYARLSDEAIETREPIIQADYVIVLDPAIFRTFNPLSFLKSGGSSVINTARSEKEIKVRFEHPEHVRVFTLDATAIATAIYGHSSIPRTNIAVLGAFVAATSEVKMKSIDHALEGFFSGDLLRKAKKSGRMSYAEISKRKGQSTRS